MFSGIGLIRSRDRRFERAREADAVAGEARVAAPGRTARRRADRWSSGRDGRSRAAALRGARPRPRRAAPPRPSDRPSRARIGRGPPRSAPCSRSRRRRARRRSSGRRRRSPRTSDCRLPDAASRAAAHDGAPAPWSATPIRIASSSRRSPATAAARDAAGRSVGERRLPHQVEDVVSANPDVVGAGVDDRGAPGVHSSGRIIRPCGVADGGCYGNGTVTPLVCRQFGC